jgi:hypothetical protein
MASKAGGGIRSKNVVRPPSRQGMPARGVNPGHVAQTGSALGNHSTDSQGKRLTRAAEPKFTQSPHSVPLGNALATNVGKGGPGTGRVVYGCGTQGQTGPAAGSVRPAGRDILSEFGPDSPGVRGRR